MTLKASMIGHQLVHCEILVCEQHIWGWYVEQQRKHTFLQDEINLAGDKATHLLIGHRTIGKEGTGPFRNGNKCNGDEIGG